MKKYGIIGAIVGDVIGSRYEFNNVKEMDFELFDDDSEYTDDSILTLATMAVLNQKSKNYGYKKAYYEFGTKYPDSYGPGFVAWLFDDKNEQKPYNSFGNGSAMRVSPVAWAFDSLEAVLKEAKRSAEVTHNHPEGIKGAQATAAAVYMARTGKSKQEIKDFISKKFHYNLNRTIDEIRPSYEFSATCQDSVPEAIIAFLESKDFENAIRLAVSLGGDSDTIACITGAISEAYYKKIPDYIAATVLRKLPLEFLEIIAKFSKVNLLDIVKNVSLK